MVYEPLHHKYRPQTFGDLVGQGAIATTLTNAIKQQKIAPAYLFCGPRGTGKTSSARILAKSLNCLSSEEPNPSPCGKCEVCRSIARGSALDVIEIDAASNTGVDNIREIIEKARFAPVQCRYKVYVIDECHMLSTAAFNALLKTLEEPPARVIFILATTDPQRVLPTIISRCQRFDYRRIPLEDMVFHLQYIARQEKINITPEAITLVAQIAQGGLRDAESLLDQLSLLSDTVTVERVWDLVGAVPEQDLLKLLLAIRNNQAEAILTQCRHLLDRGREPLVVLQNLASFYLNLLIAKQAPSRPDLVAVTEATWQKLLTEAQQWEIERILQGQQQLKDSEGQIKNTTQPRLWLEVTLLALLPQAISAQPTVPPTQITQPLPSPVPPLTPPAPPNLVPAKTPTTPYQENTAVPTHKSTPAPTPPSVSPEEIWQQLLDRVQPPTTQALLAQHCHLLNLRGSIVNIGITTKNLLTLAQAKVNSIEATLAEILGYKVQVRIEPVDAIDADTNHSPARGEKQPFSPPVPEQRSTPPTERTSSRPNANRSLTETSSLASSPEAPPTPSPQPLAKSPTEKTNINLQQAAENIAQFFQGEIISLEDRAEEIEPVETQQYQIINRPKLEDLDLLDDEDIPF